MDEPRFPLLEELGPLDWTAADAAPNLGPARDEQLVRLRPARRALRARYRRAAPRT